MKKFYNLALSFVLFLLMIFLSFLLLLKFTVLNENYMRKQMIESQYAENLIEEMQTKLDSLSIASGIDKKVYEPVVTTERIKTDVFREIGYLYEKDSKRANLQSFSQDLYDSAMKQMEARGLTITPELDRSVKNFVTSATATYSDGIRLPFMAQIKNVIHQIGKGMNIALGLVAVMIMVDMGILFVLNLRIHARKLRYFIYATGATVLTLLFLLAGLQIMNRIDNIGISIASLYSLVVVSLNNMIGVAFQITALWTGVLAIFIIARVLLNKSRKISKI